MEETSKLLGEGDRVDYGVSVDMMDYKYINECNDIKMLEKVLRALRSGQQGYYPHLVKHCEEKVTKLNPKSRILRTENPILKSRDLPTDERANLANSMDDWIKNMNESDQMTNGITKKDLPPVRNAAAKKEKKKLAPKKKEERIKGSDFHAWDKYNVDEECNKLDNPEYIAPTKPKNTTISCDINASEMSELEKEISAEKEKDKGNEAFKAGDYDEALAYYSRSIILKRTAASVNNRALTYIRLKRWSDAESDCNDVIEIEPDNLKAKLRRATALKELSRCQEARTDLEFVLEKEPNNVRAKKILEEVKTIISTKGRKMKIMEVDEDEEQEDLPTLLSESTENHQTNGEITTDQQNGVPLNDESKSSTSLAEEPRQENNVEPDIQASLPVSQAINTEVLEACTEPGESQLNDSESNSPPPVVNEPVVLEVVQTPLPANLERIKAEAGNFFRAGQYGEAADKYSLAIKKLNRKIDADSESNYTHALATLYNNRAACELKSGSDKACIADCGKVLELKPGDVKALIRRASAYEHMEKYKQAYEDFRAAQSIDWNASQAQVGANRVAKHLRDVHGPNWREKETGSNQKNESSTNPSVVGNKTTSADSKPPTKKTANSFKSSVPEKPIQNSASQTNGNKSKDATTKGNKSSTKKTADKSGSNDMEEKREKIRQDLFAQLKADGNASVRKGEYSAAIDNYTKCMKILPKEVASYTNRALCFLKLNKNLSAVQDCTEAIKLDPVNVKGHFRRGQANKNLKQYHDAERDLKKVLEIDPGNKLASNELNEVKKLLKPPTKRKIPIVEVDEEEPTKDTKSSKEDASPIKQSSTKVDPQPRIPKTPASDAKEKESDKEQVQSSDSAVDNKPIKEHDGSKDASSALNENTDDANALPQVPPKVSPYEFGNLWNSISLKTNVAAYKCILDSVSVEQIPSMVSNKTTDHMITMFAKIAQSHLKAGTAEEANRAYGVLAHLIEAQRFNMAAMFLSKSDKNNLGETFAQLANCIKSLQVSYTFDDVNKLRSAYML